MSCWIPITESLPDADITVLISNVAWNEPVELGYFAGDVWCDQSGAVLSGIDYLGVERPEIAPPTHWMQLPEPPEPSPARKAVITITEMDDSTLNVALEFFPAALANEPTTPSIAAALAAMSAITAAARGEEVI